MVRALTRAEEKRVDINLECIRESMSEQEIMDALEQMGYNLEEEQ